MRILSFDQSTNRVGWSLFVNDKLEDFGLIDLEKEIKHNENYKVKDYFERILLFREILVDMAKSMNADIVIFEDVVMNSFGANKTQVDTFRKLVESLMSAQLTSIDNNIQCMIVPANVWRKGLNFGRKREEIKTNTIRYINKVFSLDFREYNAKSKDNDDDMADAIGIGFWASRNIKSS